jgi:polyhydroxybutyrate depolymerase
MQKTHFLIHLFIVFTAFFYGTVYCQEIEIVSDGETRTFKVNFPVDTSESLPLIILMHGLGETNSNMYGVANYFSNRDFIAVRPQSGNYLNSSGMGYTTLWNAVADTQKLDDVQFISDIIDYMLINYDFVDFNRIYTAGFSNGGYMAYRLSCDLSKRITAFGSVAGNMYLIDDGFDCTDQEREIPIIHIHGTGDTFNPYYPGGYGVFGDDIIGDQYLTIGESIDFWSTYHQYDIMEIDTILTDVSIKYTYSSDSTTSEFLHIKAENGGHIWFYGDNWGFSSTQEILEFSSQYELSDFIINIEDTNNDGLFNIDDIDMVVESILESELNNMLYDFSPDQIIDIFDILILCDIIFNN